MAVFLLSFACKCTCVYAVSALSNREGVLSDWRAAAVAPTPACDHDTRAPRCTHSPSFPAPPETDPAIGGQRGAMGGARCALCEDIDQQGKLLVMPAGPSWQFACELMLATAFTQPQAMGRTPLDLQSSASATQWIILMPEAGPLRDQTDHARLIVCAASMRCVAAL